MIGWAHEVAELPQFVATRAQPPLDVPPGRGGHSAATAAANDAAVLDTLQGRGLRNGELAAATGLSRATISAVCRRLEKAGKLKADDSAYGPRWWALEPA